MGFLGLFPSTDSYIMGITQQTPHEIEPMFLYLLLMVHFPLSQQFTALFSDYLCCLLNNLSCLHELGLTGSF